MKQNYDEKFKQDVRAVTGKLDMPQEMAEQLAFLNNTKGSNWGGSHYKVVYTSRTHSQLAQAMKELKVTEYRHLKGVALGSRDQLCINEEVLKDATTSGEKVHLCRAKVKAKTCGYHGKIDQAIERPEVQNQPVLDIEDLVKIGKSCSACPYYMAKALSGEADIVFLPYNYVLDPKLLKSFALKLDNSVVILDEAHNVEKVCQDAASCQIASSDIATCIEDITYIMKMLDEDKSVQFVGDDSVPDFTIEDCAKLKEMMLTLEKSVDDIKEVTTKGRTLPGGTIFEILNEAHITQISYQMIVKLIDSLLEFLTNSSAGKIFARKGYGLSKVSELLGTVYGNMTKNVAEWKQTMEIGYRLHVEIEPPKKRPKSEDNGGWLSTTSVQTTINNNAKILNYWCFNPGFGMANLTNRNVHSIILTSGTLSPLKPLISELGLGVNHQLENPHVIKPSQVLAKVIPQGPDGTPLNASYQNRDNPKFIHSMGMTIKTIAQFTPNGLLVFFPSYTVMNKMQETWQQTGLWNTINEVKPIFTEPRRKEEFDTCMTDYYTAVNVSRGAIFMAVLRGKVSEGLDFKDQNGRAVIIVGIPFPPLVDPRVVLKKEYLETNRNQINQLQNGQQWYNMEATRAVNQAIGRVIRHKDDFGAIFLCDLRFNNYKQGLSRWVQSHIQPQIGKFSYGPIIAETNKFFRNAETSLPKPLPAIKPEPMDVDAFNVAKVKTEKLSKNQIKIENSNEIYGSSSRNTTDYDKLNPFIKKEQKPGGFLGNLGEDVTTYDFKSVELGNSSGYQKPTLPKQPLDEYENASKKPKLKMTTNTSPKEVNFVVLQTPVEVSKEAFNKPVPEDRKEFMEVVRK